MTSAFDPVDTVLYSVSQTFSLPELLEVVKMIEDHIYKYNINKYKKQ